MGSFQNYLFNEKVEQDGKRQTALTDDQLCPKEVTSLSVKKNCAAGVSVDFLDDLQQSLVNVGTSHNIT
ncbi:hypothetical protein DPMN_014433 [Dreissena polymorpha]|uniref:Uncharacterized protein n=1 Tax=Dreissena polymorpha TaxID=45954 RepID=A0A9D4S2P9_DREPO|nr:hypothetical protein DPMN_014433 [Dreissena polymorpha]